MSSINCIEFGRLVEQAVESRTPVDSDPLRAHAAQCAACRATWQDAILLDGAVAEWRKTGKQILPSVDLADIVLARRSSGIEPVVSAELTPFAAPTEKLQDAETGAEQRVAAAMVAVAELRPTRRSARGRVAASAILLGIAASVAFFWSRADRRDEIQIIKKTATAEANRTVVQANPSTRVAPSNALQNSIPTSPRVEVGKASDPANVEAPPVEAMVQGAQTAYIDLANQAAQAVAGASALVPRPNLASVMPASREENDRWVEDVGHQFEPVGKNLSQAFQFIIEAVPSDKAPAT